ncbi:hypothetical protein PCYB_031670 [Plasmodium cynomolgi strain B]|uniref:Uncharacterized protein n=1 Tax=Plasmodium cynomolgi (strain B) TaxID=1120755 RepID=K6UPV7_PLACD|nr:hypothetical protein PCYB_031670 [Plasmodium cynomolgi strain B]GAB64754.1 hypothetical protein PCYB_031670 [Plasmodium cynomolgi strain B]
MKTWSIGTPEIVTQNHLPVHFKYPSSIQVAIFSKHVEKLQMVDISKLMLYKNNDYYMKAFLVDEHENVILTNEPFTYTLEEEAPSSGDLLKICLKDKSRYLEVINEKRKNVTKTNSTILINCNDEGAFEAKGVLTIQNELVYETDHLEIHFAFAKLTKVKVSLLFRNAEKGDQMAVVPMRVQFFDKYNRKVNMLPTQLLQVKLAYDYDKRIEMAPLNWTPQEWNERMSQLQTTHEQNERMSQLQTPHEQNERVGQLQTPQRSTTEEPTAVTTDMFFQVRTSHEGKYYIQMEVKYKLANKHISILSNMTPLIVYSRGVSLYGGGNSILIHPYEQTVEVPFQLCHPLIHKVICVSKNEKLVEVEGVFKSDGEKCAYVCSIKSGYSMGNTEIHVFPIFESYYAVFSQDKGRTNFKSIEKLEEDFHNLERYYDHYLEHCKEHKKGYNMDAHTCEEIENEKKLRNLFFLKFDVTVDYVRSMKLFAEDTIRLVPHEEIHTFASFYRGGGDTRPFLSLDFRLLYERTAELFQVEYFVNDGSVLLGDGRRDREEGRHQECHPDRHPDCHPGCQPHRQPDGPPPARRTIVTDLRVSPDAFLSIEARNEGRFFLYANFTKYSGNSHQGEVVYSQVYNLVVQRRATQGTTLPVVHLSSNGVYKFDRNFHCLAIFANWTYEQRLLLSQEKNVHTERKPILHNAHYWNRQENIYKKFIIKISEISTVKVYNYYGKFIPLNVVQYLSVHLYNINMERVIPPLNGKLYVHVSHPSVLTVRAVGPNHMFIVPHRIGCSFVCVRFELHPGNHPGKHPPNDAQNNPRDGWPTQGSGESAPTSKMYLCVTKRVPTKYFQQRKNCYYLNRVYKLLGRYSHRFFQQPYMCVDSVTTKEEAKLGKVRGALLSKSNFYRVYKHYDGIFMVKKFEDLFQPPTGHLSIINDHCSGLKL